MPKVNLKVVPLRRQRKPRMNMASFMFHSVRENFKNGVIYPEYIKYLEDTNIEYNAGSVRGTFRLLAGQQPQCRHRNEFVMRRLKKDILPIQCAKGIKHHQFIRYSFNPKGNILVQPLEGRGVWHNIGLTDIVVLKLARITKRILDITKF